MKQFLILLSITLFSLNLSAQCLPNGITFTTQTQIDNFATDYPGCTQIMGDLRIEEASLGDITSLSGLSTVTSITGSLEVIQNDALTTLSGLGNLTSIDGAIDIQSNNSLSDLIGLANINATDITHLIITNNQNLSSCNVNAICDYLEVYTNSHTISNNGFSCHDIVSVKEGCGIDLCPTNNITFSRQSQIDSFAINYPGCKDFGHSITIEEDSTGKISNLNGLLGLEKINADLMILENDSLENLSGLDSLKDIGAELHIKQNISLNTLNGLNELIEVREYVVIFYNPSLTSLTGLSSLKKALYLDLDRNDGLINLSGLDSLKSLSKLTIDSNNSLTSLTGLGNLNSVGQMIIWDNSSLPNLNGLDNLKRIGFELSIENNYDLIDLTGLESVTTLGQLFIGYNSSLKNMTGLENLVSTGSTGIEIIHNSRLSSLAALNNLISMDTTLGASGSTPTLRIQSNSSLTSLSGLDNIDPASISNVQISENDQLTTCEVLSICNYLGIPANTATIENNKTGCDTRLEVETACNPNSIAKNDFGSSLISYPNPTQGKTVIELGEIYPEIKLTARNMIGQTVFTQSFHQVEQVTFDLEGPNGVYLIDVQTSSGKTAIIKVIKE